MQRRLGLTLAALLPLLVACGGSEDSSASEPENTPTTTLEATPEEPSASPTGIEPNVGDRALRVGDTREGTAATMTLEEITFPLQSDNEFRTPTNPDDVFLGLQVEQCVDESFNSADFGGDFYSTNNSEWYAASPNGEQIAGTGSFGDWPRPKFPESVTMAPGECLTGMMALEVPSNFKIEKLIWRSAGSTVAEWLP